MNIQPGRFYVMRNGGFALVIRKCGWFWNGAATLSITIVDRDWCPDGKERSGQIEHPEDLVREATEAEVYLIQHEGMWRT